MSRTQPSNPAQTNDLQSLSGRVADLASDGILAVEPDAPLAQVAWLMANNAVHAVVVVRDDLPEPPVISDADLIAAAVSGHFDNLKAEDVAVTEPVSIDREESLARAAQMLSEHDVTHLIVRDERRAPAGILSTLDLARALGGGEVGAA